MIGKFKDYYKKKTSKSPTKADGPGADDVDDYLNSELMISPAAVQESGQAIQFIHIDEEEEHFEVTPEAMGFLASLPRDKQIKVVAVAGPYRTGKSFIMNRYLGQMKGFEIGTTVESCTKGIWMWNQPIIDGSDVDENITILIDTEGLHSSERTTDVDLKIFALTILLCSSFVYN